MKKVVFNPTTQEKLLEGVRVLSEAVGTTLGPKGNNVVIEGNYSRAIVTKDGVTVAKHISLEDPIENLGCDIVKQSAEKTASVAGDGTTTSTVIAYHLAKNGAELINAGIPAIAVKRGYENYLLDSLEILSKNSKMVGEGDVKRIATISANNDEELGELISQAASHASGSGLVTVEESKTGATYISTINGSLLDRGYLSTYFITDENKKQVIYDNPLFLITDKKLRTTNEIIPAMEAAARASRPLVVIADELEAAALQLLVLNKIHGKLPCVAIKAPAFGARRVEILEDLAALTSAKVISELKGHRLEEVTFDDLGSAAKIIVSAEETLVIDPLVSDIESRIAGIKHDLNNAPSSYDFEKLSQRLSMLEGKASVIYVGASTETEMQEKKDRVDDALRATRAAMEKGYVVGGGYALIDIANQIHVTDPIGEAFVEALASPAMLIRSNAGHAVKNIFSELEKHGQFNSLTSQYSDLIKDGVIDPALVTEQALRNAVSAASMILLARTAVYKADRKPEYNPGSMEDFQ